MRRLCIALVCSTIPAIAMAQDCGAILRSGIYDITRAVSNTERAEAFANWYKSKDFKTLQEAKSFGFNAAIPIDGMLVGVGLTADESGFQQFLNEIETYATSSSKFKQSLASEVQTINPNVVNAWTQCINADGMHFWIERAADPRAFFIYAKYRDDGSGAKPRLTAFTIDNVTTNGGPFMDVSGVAQKLDFTGARVSQAFTIKNPRATTNININASVGQGLATSIPGQVPVIRFTISPATIWAGQSAKLSWHVRGADSYTVDGISKKDLPVGSKEVTPQQTATYNLFAYSDDQDHSRSVTLTVNQPTLSRVIYSWFTSGDDKDWNSNPRIAVLDKDGSTIVDFGCCSSDRPRRGHAGDRWDKGITQTREVPGNLFSKSLPKTSFTNGTIRGSRNAVGNDDWDYTATVTLVFTDGTQIVRSASGRNSVQTNW